MREIKFRCWNKHSSIMHQWDELCELNKIHLLEKQRLAYPMMQFTGLKDINGTDIYEGDMLHQLDPLTWDPVVVEYSKTNASFMADGYISQDNIMSQELIVIGNIYENQDMIGVQYEKL